VVLPSNEVPPNGLIEQTPMMLPPPAFLDPSALPSSSSSHSPPPIWSSRDRILSKAPSTPSSEYPVLSKPSPFDSNRFSPLDQRQSPSIDFSRSSLVSPVLPGSFEGGSGGEEISESLMGSVPRADSPPPHERSPIHP
jgi:hypothetical protein